MDRLFKEVFQNAFLRKKIFYQVANDVNCKTRSYKYCFDVYWLLRKKYYSLLQLKLKHNEYLTFNKQAQELIFQLQDTNLFIECYKRLNFSSCGQVDSANSVALLINAARGRNRGNIYYFLEKINYKFSRSMILLQYLVEMNDVPLVREYLKQTKYVEDEIPFYLAIETKNTEMIKLIFDAPRKDYGIKVFEKHRERLLTKAMASGDINIFNMVRNYVDEAASSFFSFKKANVLANDQILLSRVFNTSIRSTNTMKYMIENYGASVISRENMFILVATHGCRESVEYLIDSKILTKETYCEVMAKTLLCYGHFQLHEFLQIKFNLPFVPAPKDFNYFRMLNPTKSLDEVKYIYETLKVFPRFDDLEKSASISLDIFKYIFHLFDPATVVADETLVNSIVTKALTNNHFDIIIFLFQNGITRSVWGRLESLPISQTIYFIQQCFKLCTPSPQHVPHLLETLGKFIQFNSDFKMFKTLFNEIYPFVDDKKLFYGSCLCPAARAGRLKVIKFFFDNGLKPDQKSVFPIVLESARGGSLVVLKYILEKSYQDTQEIMNQMTSDSSILMNAIANDNLDCLEYLIPMFPPNFSIPTYSLASSLGSSGNLFMIKYLYGLSAFSTNTTLFGQVLHECRMNGYFDIVRYLLEKGVQDLECNLRLMNPLL
ncbi:hypothetical protein CYY_003901 [Polysphondylium violaceum]|uniref:Ankyrin repeat-containing protein n=1 Tax=Polysphondylium violaceum TaxID=133409 RepID=A0A8J4PVH7_9MYCE|nr:hypothetical protein CYY_003901 [Polysphondylium violaceum]